MHAAAVAGSSLDVCGGCHFLVAHCRCGDTFWLRRRREADALTRAGLVTLEQREKYLTCEPEWREFTCENGHQVCTPRGTCGLDFCKFCRVSREGQRARRAWASMNGWTQILSSVWTIPPAFVERTGPAEMKAIEREVFAILRDALRWRLFVSSSRPRGGAYDEDHWIGGGPESDPAEWEAGCRFDWDTSGDTRALEWRPHLNVTTPSVLMYEDPDAGPWMLDVHAWLDLPAVKQRWRMALARVFGVSVAEVPLVDMWAQYRNALGEQTHWVRYAVLGVASVSDATEGQLADGLDARLWSLQRRGVRLGWLQSRAGWSKAALIEEAQRSNVWQEPEESEEEQRVISTPLAPDPDDCGDWEETQTSRKCPVCRGRIVWKRTVAGAGLDDALIQWKAGIYVRPQDLSQWRKSTTPAPREESAL